MSVSLSSALSRTSHDGLRSRPSSPAPRHNKTPSDPPKHIDLSALNPPLSNLPNERSPLLDIYVPRPSSPAIRQQQYLSAPSTAAALHEPLAPSFFARGRGGPLSAPTLSSRWRLFWIQLISNTIATAFLIFIVLWALTSRSLAAIPSFFLRKSETQKSWDDEERWKQEQLLKDPKYYARSCGFDMEDQTVTTEDGYLLRVHKVIVPKARQKVQQEDGRGGYPVIIQHGLFQTSGSFVTSEERSLAFWLAEHGGYQVYLSNARAVFDMGHVNLKRSDPRFWDYNIKELALYDLPAVVDHVLKDTGYEQAAYIGHSQGNATMFCTLAGGMKPELGDKISLFVALAPAVFSGPLTTGFPFTALKDMDWPHWRRVFGVLDFIPIMRKSYDLVPALPFSLLGYQMFAFLFQWTDKNWLKRRKPKMFRFTPSPVSSASIFWWTGKDGFSTRGCVLDPTVSRWFDNRFPPLSLYHGGKDYLVLADKLIERIQTNEPHVNLIRVEKMDDGEHCDTFWHVDAVELCYESILEDIEKTRCRNDTPSVDIQTSE